jgi:hypothetical protein
MGPDDAEWWVMVKAHERLGHVVRRSEAIARIRHTDGGRYHWELLGVGGVSGVAPTRVLAANEARMNRAEFAGGNFVWVTWPRS